MLSDFDQKRDVWDENWRFELGVTPTHPLQMCCGNQTALKDMNSPHAFFLYLPKTIISSKKFQYYFEFIYFMIFYSIFHLFIPIKLESINSL